MSMNLLTIVSGITMELAFWIMNKEWFSLRRFDMNLLKQLKTASIHRSFSFCKSLYSKVV